MKLQPCSSGSNGSVLRTRRRVALGLLHLLKGVGQVAQGDAMEQALLGEYRRLARAYLAAA